MKVFENKVTMDNVKINLIKPMTNSPFTVKEDEDMQKLRESISQFGLLSPIVIRQLPDTNEYEIVCGNRRLQILNELGYEAAPVLINNLSDDEALVAMIDSNLCHREHILPSEKGIAYKLKLDAMKRQGYRTDLDEPTSATVLQKLKGETSIQKLSEQSGDSRETIRHYIRLTYLISELLSLVDESRIAMRPAVELSYLTPEEQQMVYAMYDSDEVTPSFPQAQRLRRLSEEGELDNDTVFNIMSELKANQKDTIRGILCNLTYTGVLRSGDSRSEVIPELQIIPPEQFERALMIMKERSDRKKENPTVPLNTKGKSLLSGNIYCGHCGSRLNLTTSGRYRKRKDGSVDTTKRIRYACYGKSRKQTECDGQSGYTLHILDDLIDEIVRDIFSKMKGVSKNDVIMSRYANELEARKARYSMLKTAYSKEFENLTILKSEVVKSIKGESSFSADTLSELIAESEKECGRLFDLCGDAEKDVADGESVLKNLSDSFDELISWAELYDEASFEKKKMIVNCLIKRVEVYRGYKLKVEFNIDFEQFIAGIDKVA
ncbi:MAG: ParB/RepB/Spo0J family partition protein [Clostridia bacterium]|nr:ParB/RepB/Spo0J family partition protein [Clostridia bacterium]